MRVVKIVFLAGIFICLIIGVGAFSFNPFEWFKAKDVRLTGSENYDVNRDGITNNDDFVVLYNCVNETISSSSQDCRFADLNGDNSVDNYDLIVLNEYLLEREVHVYQCSDNQTILKLSSENNAHGAVWSSAENYPVRICYNRIFGREYNLSGETIHKCRNNTNLAFRINDLTNAHAQLNSIGSYGVGICFGDLECTSRVGENCNETERLLVSLSSNTDAHLSATDLYPIRICCTSQQRGQIIQCPEDAEPFEDTCRCLDEEEVYNYETGMCEVAIIDECSSGERLCIVDGVTQCSVPSECDSEAPCNENNRCEIGESCSCADCYGFRDSCADELICDYKTNTCQLCPGTSTFAENVNNLLMSTCFPDPIPRVKITHPQKFSQVGNWSKFAVGRTINFNQIIENAHQVLRDVNIEWDFGNGKEIKERCLTTGNCNTTRTYDRQAHYTITAESSERSGSLRKSSDFTDILVYEEGLNLFAIISEPENGRVIESGEVVTFNANESFVSECFVSRATCEREENAGALSPPIPCYQVENLYCYDYPKPNDVRYNEFGRYNFIFNWTFDFDKPDKIHSIEGVWNESGYGNFVEFEKIFEGDEGTNHTARLIVKYRFDG
ncbi:MAG: dockerin type I repeat-containing protein [Candidatus Pacearchaeota archaeon]